MHRFILNPTRSARRTLRHVCVATLGIPPEKCGCDDTPLAFLRNATQHQARLGSPKRPHIRAAYFCATVAFDSQYRRSTFKTERALDFASPFLALWERRTRQRQ